MGKTLDKIQYEMEKLGLVFNPDDGYVLKAGVLGNVEIDDESVSLTWD